MFIVFNHVIQEYKIFVNDDLVGMTTENSFAVKGLSPGTFYVVTVTPIYKEEEGDSVSIMITTSDSPIVNAPLVTVDVPDVPQQLRIVSFNVTSFTVSWLPVLRAHVSIGV